jgi:transcriptional antiterminator/mannitol/fructose-specific phosphotransferase system IIA component (Ntr-type)
MKMPSLDTRARDILINLLRAEKPLAAKDIANQLGITQRAVNYSLNNMATWLEGRDIQLQKKPGAGILINASVEKKKKLVSELHSLSGYSLVLSPVERQRFLLLSLLTDDEPILSKIAALSLGVSKPTILNDLDKVEDWLLNHEIRLIRQPGTGFRVQGREINFRNAIEDVLLETIGEVSLLALYQGEHNSFLSRVEKEYNPQIPLPFVQDSATLRFCGRLVERIEEMHDFFFSDSSHISLALFFYILIRRNLEEHYLGHFSTELNYIRKSKEYAIAEGIVNKINLRFDTLLPDNEISNIVIRIMSVKRRQSVSAKGFIPGSLMTNEEFEDVIFKMVLKASNLLHPILSVDQKLIRGLMIHLRPAINRLSFNLPIRNILLPEIQEKYPYIFMVAEKSVTVLEEKLGIKVSKEEVGYIAMHLGAAMERLKTVHAGKHRALIVCGGGCATAYMLVSRIQAEFPEIEVVDVCSMLELSKERIQSLNLDFIISSIQLENVSIPCLLVNPLLNDADKSTIRNFINIAQDSLKSKNNRGWSSGFSITSLLTEETVQSHVKAENWQDAVIKVCAPLVKNNSIEEIYVGGIKELLEKHGPYMVLSPEIVLLHAMVGYGVNHLCMGLTTFSPPVHFGHKDNDPVSVGIVFGTVDSRSHLKALSQLSHLLGDRQLIQAIKEKGSSTEILKLVSAAVKKQSENRIKTK